MVCGICSLPCFLCSQINKRATNYSYLSYLLVSMILCIIFQFFPNNDTLYSTLDSVFGYHGIQLNYRVSLGTCCAYAFMALLVAIFPFLHHACVFLFTFLYALFVCLFLWAFRSSDFIVGYRNVAFYFSAFYVFIQLVSLVDGSYYVHETLSNKMNEYETAKGYKPGESPVCGNQYKLFYLTISFLLIIIALGFHIYFYFLFQTSDGLCSSYSIMISVSLILGLIAIVGSLFSPANIGLLPPSVFFLCITFYLYLGLISNPDASCNPFISMNNIFVEIINIILCLCIASYYALRIQPAYNDDALNKKKDIELGKKELSLQAEDSRIPALYHLSNAILSIYLCMLTTFWYNGDINVFPDLSSKTTIVAAYWIYNACVWIGFLLFIWTIIAPLVLKNRDFSH